ncbi:MAG: ABC transporter substrate-binding protein, partial [Chloroflexi bacterium]|nr:ABC transporter substrate-binding protein [Chloroflexota bacterium]
VVALVGETSSGVALAEAPIVNQAGIPWVITVSTGTMVTQQAPPNYLFRVSLVDRDQTQVAVDAALADHSSVALLSDTSGYGQGGLTDLLAALDAAGIEPVANETYAVGDTDMTPQISRIQSAGADVIINWGLGPEAAQIRRAMQQVGVDIPMIGSWGLSMPNYFELAGDLADGTLVVQAFSFDTDDADVVAVREAYEEQYDTDRIAFPNGVANSYDGLGLLAAAIEDAGSTEPDAIREALLDVEYDGLIKDYEGPWNDDDREALGADDMFLTRLDGGAFVPVDG